MPSSNRIGVDGGGTKTELILIDKLGEVISRHTAPGCNPSVVGPERARAILVEALHALRLRAANPSFAIDASLLCMAGSPNFWREVASSLDGYGKVETATDAMPVLELATSGQPGLVLHAGTGSFVALRASDGSIHSAGGFGWRIGDPGSAQDIGRRAIARALAELQGWAPASALGPALVETFDTDKPSGITAALHRDAEPNLLIGAFAARVSVFAAEGDLAAREIVLASTGELLDCAEAAARTVFCIQNLNTTTAGLSGPILTQSFVINALQARTALPLKPLAEPPIEGVRRLLLRRH
jgi:N-acetylglucosamine kinase-like BadF-type ATPase